MGKWILGLLLLVSAYSSQAACGDTIKYAELNKTYLKSYWHDSKSFVVSLAKWKSKQWIELGVVAGAGVLAYTQDEKIQKYFVGHQSETADNLSKYVFEPFGRFAPVLIGSLYLGGRLAKDNRLAGTSLTAAKAFVVSAVAAGIVKQLTHRHRPYQDDIPDHANWDGPFSSIEYTSFPSGHATFAAVIMTLTIHYSHKYIKNKIFRYITYFIAVCWFILVSYSRLYLQVHFLIDIIVGGFIGIISTIVILNTFKHFTTTAISHNNTHHVLP